MTGPKPDGAPAAAKRPRFFVSLRFLASLAAACLVGVTVLVAMAVNEHNLRKALVQASETQLVLEARNLAITSSGALLSDFPELTLVPLVSDILHERTDLRDVVIIDRQGRIQGSGESRDIGKTWQGPADLTPIRSTIRLDREERLSESDQVIMVVIPVRYDVDAELGAVAMILEKSTINAALRQARLKLMTIAAGLLAVAVLLTAVIMSNMFRPISALRAGLERIGRGDLDAPMAIRDFTELGLLAESVNTMAGQLKASQNLAAVREQEIVETQKEVINTLGQVMEGRSAETANHTLRVGDMSYELARLSGMRAAEAELIRIASPMHDVGKIGVPDSILNKPGKLTDEEYTIMKTHATVGFGILNKSSRPVFKAAAIIAHQHHERWDGRGYPRGLRGEEIHIYGRIVGLVDVFDAIFSDRVYRKAMPLEKALQIMREETGSHFDPYLGTLFLDNLPKFLAIAERYEDWPAEEPLPAAAQPATEPESQLV